MPELTAKEQNIARIAAITNLANSMQEAIRGSDADVAMVVDAALMIVRGAAKQCHTNEYRCLILDMINDYLVDIVSMNSSSPVASSDSPITLQ